MRLDISIEAARLAAIINSTKTMRVAAWLDGEVKTYNVRTPTADKLWKTKASKIIGVYEPGVTAGQIADDLELML